MSFVSASPQLNSANLFFGSVVCFQEKNATESAFLLLVGQARATTDMLLFEPDNDEEHARVANLWGLIFYQFGGTGDNAIYQDSKQLEALLGRVDTWDPGPLSTYNPGWRAKYTPSEEKYRSELNKSKQHRRNQLTIYARLISDPRYFRARMELEDIQARNPKGIVQGTADGKRAEELMGQMRTLEQELNGQKQEMPN